VVARGPGSSGACAKALNACGFLQISFTAFFMILFGILPLRFVPLPGTLVVPEPPCALHLSLFLLGFHMHFSDD